MVTVGAVVVSYARLLSCGDNSGVSQQGQSISCGVLSWPYFVCSLGSMRKPVVVTTIILLCLSAPLAAQPFRKSMAECEGLYAFGRDFIEREDNVHFLEYGQAKWMNAAILQAQSEGIANPSSYVDAAMTAKYEEWNARGITVVFTEEFGDWMDYCRLLARAGY